uniref:Uncharacterized protein n=1 Tax=Chlamydomonas leiostraca TaxID=1034604 RepID=A0A7S0RTY6_9CHLO|mmetsp:Transcript_30206/g.76993  ORF Transcript_30206/g.76993 Transcript_30206/m.76993 type:complete len:137 (+) Transcript_30206:708-1118(+)
MRVTCPSCHTVCTVQASKGNAAMLRILHSAQANLRKSDSTGSTPLHRAASTGKAEAVRVLVEECKVPLNPQDKEGNSPLHVALMCEHHNVALYLTEKGADVRVANKAELSPLDISGKLRPAMMQAAGLDADMVDGA